MNRNRPWRWPSAIAALTVLGLLAALLGEGGAWWALSWGALSAPLLLVVAVAGRRAVSRRRSSGT